MGDNSRQDWYDNPPMISAPGGHFNNGDFDGGPPMISLPGGAPEISTEGDQRRFGQQSSSRNNKAPHDLCVRLPKPEPLPDWVTESGTYRDGEIALNRRGYKSDGDANAKDPSSIDDDPASTLSLQDLETVRVLGKGASAVVHLAVNRFTGHLYALKDMQLSLEEASRQMIRNEIKINHRTQSPHVVQCHQSFFSDGHVYIVLEYMDGGSLADVLKRVQRIPENYLAAVSKQALHGFYDIHQRFKIIHRDIKPSNMLLNTAGQVKISDFGVSRVMETSFDLGKTFAGTYTYMSPERILGNEYGYNSDIWAFGLSILECAIGRFPYQEGNSLGSYFQLLSKITNRPPPSAPPEEFSPEFCSFISECLQKDPKRRASAVQLLEHPFIKRYSDSANVLDLLP